MVLKNDSVTSTLLTSLLDQVQVFDNHLVTLNKQVDEQFASTRKNLQSIELQLQSALNDGQSTKSQFEQQLQQIHKRLADSYKEFDHITNCISSRVDAVEHSLESKRTLELKIEERIIALEQKVDALNLNRHLHKEPSQAGSVESIFDVLKTKLDTLINTMVPPSTAALRRTESNTLRQGRRKSFLDQSSEQFQGSATTTEKSLSSVSISSASSGYHTIHKQSKILESNFQSVDDGDDNFSTSDVTDESLHKLHSTDDTTSQQSSSITDTEATHAVVEVLWAIEDLISLLSQLPFFTDTATSIHH